METTKTGPCATYTDPSADPAISCTARVISSVPTYTFQIGEPAVYLGRTATLLLDIDGTIEERTATGVWEQGSPLPTEGDARRFAFDLEKA